MFSASWKWGLYLYSDRNWPQGKISPFVFITSPLLTGHNLRPIDPISCNWSSLMPRKFFSKGIPQTLGSFLWWRYFWMTLDVNLSSIHRVATEFPLAPSASSMASRSLSSSPVSGGGWNSGWELYDSLPSAVSSAGLHILISSCVLIIVKGPLKEKNFSMRNNYGYCSCTWYRAL